MKNMEIRNNKLGSFKRNEKEKNRHLRIVVDFLSTSFDLIRSVLIRLIFCVHLLVAIFLVCYVKEDLWYLVNSVGIIFIVIEWLVLSQMIINNFFFSLSQIEWYLDQNLQRL